MNRREKLHREYHEDLVAAYRCSERALNGLSVEFGPQRGVFYRWRLKRAQNALKRLVAKEYNREEPFYGPHST